MPPSDHARILLRGEVTPSLVLLGTRGLPRKGHWTLGSFRNKATNILFDIYLLYIVFSSSHPSPYLILIISLNGKHYAHFIDEKSKVQK